jgi:hypothetical protein
MLRPHTHTVPHLLAEDRITLLSQKPTQCNMHKYLALARVSCNVSLLILGVSERRPREGGRSGGKGGKQKVWQPETTV